MFVLMYYRSTIWTLLILGFKINFLYINKYCNLTQVVGFSTHKNLFLKTGKFCEIFVYVYCMYNVQFFEVFVLLSE